MIMCVAGVVIYIFSEPIIRVFSNDLEVIKYGSSYLKIAAFIGPIYPVFFYFSRSVYSTKKNIFNILFKSF